MRTYPLIRHRRLDAPVAFRQRPISAAEFLGDVAALAPLLPPGRHVVNMCRDRYRFMVGLGAALTRGQISLLPPNETRGVIDRLAVDHAGLYCLGDHDSMPSSLPSLYFPGALARPGVVPEIPEFAENQVAVTLFTSGSSGQPTPHAKDWGTLVRSTLAAGDRLGIAALEDGTVLGTVPHQHSYGLESTIMLTLQHGLALDAERTLLPGDICAHLGAARRPRLLVTTPIHLRALLADAGQLPPADLLLCATAPLARQLAADAEARFQAPLYEIYGCSEVGQMAVRRTVETEAWRCLQGIRLRQDASGTWAADEGGLEETLLNDVIELRDDATFLLRGRTADLVNIAGKRTSLVHLNHQLNTVDGVRDGVFILPQEEEGEVTRLMAFVVAPGLSADAILAALRERIDAAFLPRPLYLLEALPRNALGKLTREEAVSLAARLGPG